MGLLEMYQSFKGHLLKELQVFFDLHRIFLKERQNLVELRNRILRFILLWSLLCLIRLYVGLNFLWFLLEN